MSFRHFPPPNTHSEPTSVSPTPLLHSARIQSSNNKLQTTNLEVPDERLAGLGERLGLRLAGILQTLDDRDVALQIDAVLKYEE